MAKPTPEILAKARALFEAGKSLREIEADTGISPATLSRISKKEGWKKDELKQLVSSMAQDRVTFETLEATQKEVVSQLVDDDVKRLFNFRKRRDKIAELAYDRLEKEIPFCEVQHVKPLIEAADKVSVMVGDNPRFNPNATTNLTNINAQQNNQDTVRDEIIRRVLSGDG
jgi:predicted transcriptional regulator